MQPAFIQEGVVKWNFSTVRPWGPGGLPLLKNTSGP